MATREDVLAALKAKGYNGPIPGGQQQQQNSNDVTAMLNGVQPNMGQSLANAMSVLGGGKPIHDQSSDYRKIFAEQAIKQQFENDPNSLDYKSKMSTIALNDEKAKLAKAGYIQDENGVITKVDAQKPESPTERIFKRKELDELSAEAENTRQQSGLVENAIPAIQNIDRGVLANARRSWNKFFGQDNPDLADWQSLKSLLTGIQLDMSDRTKGAISDKEMATFERAVANDDFASAMQQTKVLNAYYNKIHGRLDSKMLAYEDMFNEDPRQFKSMQNLPVKKEGLFGETGNGVGSTKSGNKFRKVS